MKRWAVLVAIAVAGLPLLWRIDARGHDFSVLRASAPAAITISMQMSD